MFLYAAKYIHVQFLQGVVLLLGVRLQNRILGVRATHCASLLLPTTL